MKTSIFKKLKNLRDNIRFLQHRDLRDACSIHAEELLAFRRYAASLPPIKIPKILTIEETAKMLASTDKSIARYGDGEFLLMNNEGIPFQDADERLGCRLREIIREPPASCEVAIGRAYWYYEDRVREYAKKSWGQTPDFLGTPAFYRRCSSTGCCRIFATNCPSNRDVLAGYEKMISVLNLNDVTT